MKVFEDWEPQNLIACGACGMVRDRDIPQCFVCQIAAGIARRLTPETSAALAFGASLETKEDPK